jgi:DedD protein
MPPVLPNEQELNLKKRARRRLVGAIVMVILMLIILPKILQDRAALAPQAAIKISMPEAGFNQQVDAESVAQTSLVAESAPSVSAEPVDAEFAVADKAYSQTKLDADKQKALEAKLPETKNLESKGSESASTDASAAKTNTAKIVENKAVETKTAAKHAGSFAIQVGVYSNAANVEQLQQKLTQAGYDSHTEKIATTNGDKIRLRAGKFSSRQDAVSALAKLQQVGLPGMVISND